MFPLNSSKHKVTTWATKGNASEHTNEQVWFDDIGDMGYSDGENFVVLGDKSYDPVSGVSLNSHLWRYPLSATAPYDNSYWVYTPIDAAGNYAYFAFSAWNLATAAKHLAKYGIARIGTQVLNGVCTKTGTWAASTPSGVAYVHTQSSTAGSTISTTVTGHTVVLRTTAVSNGGYGIVAIDGDYTKANRLPIFTADDYTAGLCRSTDVGKRYVTTALNASALASYDVVLADNLTDSSHTVLLEATGTKPASVGAGSRLYVGAIVGCSVSDAASAPNGTTLIMCHVEPINDNLGATGSAMTYTPEVEKAVATGTFEFLGETHASETEEAFIIYVDGVDKSAIAANAYESGAVITIETKSTLASTDATGTPAIRKRKTHTFTSYNSQHQMVVSWSATFLVDKRVKSSYPLMLPIGVSTTPALVVSASRFDNITIGSYTSTSAHLTSNDDAQHGNVRALSAIASSSAHPFKVTAEMLDGGKSVDYYSKGSPTFAFLIDRADKYNKIYFARSNPSNIAVHYTGDVIGGVVGFKVHQ